ncbi:aminotransferase class V-fold PLP-dependent enzyme [Psychroflexus montanilacus]|uniref:aminotransferase class V-fold PLP-dependent enzyme n=1 Tax=Psychroflexus montanilacus TaxID=2873598 RepID=UPI001CCDB3BA|nr:aminotransferase class V-fold PLP-dependent enzyme [Psychroflexus montanilacus]MBZ9651992.1 aminotransferase class V-fold PLP-dependent enzyme [Psychroflexus montanilacus]
MTSLKKEFPIIQSYTYLNTPFTGVIASSVSSQIQQLEEDYRLRGSLFTDQFEEDIVEKTKKLIAEIFNAKHEAVGILNNFSTGLNLILNDLPEQSKVVLLAQDYPSVNLPVKSRKFKVHEVDINLDLYTNLNQKFEEVHPDYFIFSITQFISGLQLDLSALAKLKEAFPEVSFIADATQYCGSEAFDFENSPFDVFGTSGYKWLNAGLGNAFFLMKSDFIKKHRFKAVGSNSLKAKPDGELRPTGFLEPGHYDIIAMARLKFALEFHYKTLGIEFIEAHIKDLSKKAKNEFLKLGLLDTNVIDKKSHQNIFSLKGNETAIKKLQQKGILSAYRGGRIRVGFQYFNSEKDLKTLVDAVNEL